MAGQQGYPASEAPRDGTIIQMLETGENGERYGVAIFWQEYPEDDREDPEDPGFFRYVDPGLGGEAWIEDQENFRWLPDPFASTEKP